MSGTKARVRFKVSNKIYDFEIHGKYKGWVKGFPFDPFDNMPHGKFEIKVKNLKNGVTVRFYFYSSFLDFQKGKRNLNKIDLLYAFRYLIEDAYAYAFNSIDSFAREYGYVNKPISLTLKVYKACKRQYEKVVKLGLCNTDILEIINYLNDLENEGKLKDVIVE